MTMMTDERRPKGDPMKIKMLSFAVASAGLILAPPAQADQYDQYDQYMLSHGLTTTARGMPGPGMYTLGYLRSEGDSACAAFRAGVSDAALTSQLEGGPGQYIQHLSKDLAENVVYGAHHYLCPGV